MHIDPRSFALIKRQRPAVWGAELDRAIAETPAIRPALIEDLLPQGSIIMNSSPSGEGKSVVMLTMVGQATRGLPVFNHLACLRPLRIFILCPERPATELFERVRNMKNAGAQWDSNRVCIDDGLVGLVDIANDSSMNAVMSEIDRFATSQEPQGVDLICFEGMYAMSRKPLASEEAANDFARWNAVLQYRYKGCSLWYSNHTLKDRVDGSGNQLPRTFFGSTMIMAQVTGAYIFERIKGTSTRSRMKNHKDTVSGLANELIFDYDPESFTVELARDTGLVTARERLRNFVNACYREGKAFELSDLKRISDLSHSTLKRAQAEWIAMGAIRNLNHNGQRALYTVLRPI
jgi:hypothetical protein